MVRLECVSVRGAERVNQFLIRSIERVTDGFASEFKTAKIGVSKSDP